MATEPSPTTDPDRRRRLLVLWICAFSLFMTYVDSTILNVALPTLQRDLGASLSQLQWVVDAYMVVLASLLLLSGAVADRMGRRKMFTTGLLTFAGGSLLCSLAPNIDTLIAFRALQAIGGSMLTPVSLSIVRTTFTDPAERARALGLWSAVFGLGTACGPLLGGVLVDLVGWRAVFWVNVPVGIAAFLLARRYIPESRAEHPRRVDPAGQILVIAVLASMTYAIIEGPGLGWGSPTVAGLLAFSAATMVVLVLVERRRPEPLLEIRFFRSPPFAGSNAIATLTFTVLSGFLFVNTLYLQVARGASALVAGLETLPVTALIALSAPVAGRIVARHGPRWPLVVAGGLLAVGATSLLVAGRHTPYGELVGGYLLLGIGFGLVNPPITNTAVTSMPPAQAGVASAITSATRQVGNVLGVAVAGALVGAGVRGRIGAGVDHTPFVLFAACGLACAVIGLATTSRRATKAGEAVYSDLGSDQGGGFVPTGARRLTGARAEGVAVGEAR